MYDARFDADAGRVITASGDGTARVWNSRTGQPMSEPMRHRGLVYTARFAPDGDQVLTAGEDGVIRIWPSPRPGSRSPGWLADLAELTVVLRGDTTGGFNPMGLKTWGEIEAARRGEAGPALLLRP